MKSKFLVLALVFTVLLLSNILGVSNPEEAFNSSTISKTIIRVDPKPGEIYRVELDVEGLALTHNYFSVNKALPKVKIIMERITESSAPLKLRNAYQYFTITPEGMYAYDLKNAELEFKVPMAWFKANGYDENTVALNIYDAGWRKLPTYNAGLISGDVYFTSNIDIFGYFAITAEPKVIPEEFIEEVTEIIPEEEEEIIYPAPEELGLKDWLRRTPKQVYLILAGFVIFAVALSVVFFMLHRIRHPYKRLTRFVINSLQKGAEAHAVRKILVDAGWPKDIVDNELNKYQPSHQEKPKKLHNISK